MNYEKKYKETLERARELLSRCIKDSDRRTKIYRVEDIESIFPELKENEDERIRKAISLCVEDMRGQFEKLYSVHHKDAIAWLEKQGEQKSIDNLTQQEAMDIAVAKCFDEQNLTDKVEPKFKVGDWISGYYTNYKVLSINNEGYVVEDVDGKK